MSKNIELLLVENVESLGIVGDVVNVRSGFARNYLLPRGLATTPSDELIATLATRRAEAERQLAAVRAQRESMVEKLEGTSLTIEVSCNDQGLLYGSVTQQDISKLLGDKGFGVRPRDVRIAQTIKRIGDYDLTIKPDIDLEAAVKLHVKSDRPLEMTRREAEDAAAAAHAAAAAAAAPADQAEEAPAEDSEGGKGKKKGKSRDAEPEAAPKAEKGKKSKKD